MRHDPSLNRPASAPATPPSFSLGRVASVKPLGRDFLRMRIESDDLFRFAETLIHFRLVLQPQGVTTPSWPVMDAEGRTVWPKGAAALHRPAYTVRHIDAAAGWMDTDIFVHDGGRICEFARQAESGDIIGLNGPGGGGVPTGARLLIGGDETAYPALARAIEAAPANAGGDCYLFGDSADYPLPEHPGITLHVTPRGEAELAEKLRRTGTNAQAIWIATEKSRLGPLKSTILDELGIPKGMTHLAAYWSAPNSTESTPDGDTR
ncbi:NADPH-dependent ferric siderophore reductase, contains FAD-binding and SIP domains [Paracoccus seriniphilus]|uniref:NADPH-dependent ferric siderophore reductase, contains FAD-binding and SIP domains n=2 Tax=Paracoccus seriniphilus TaxID=184748 RepID=A0A239PLB0_9RHOB|nr:siderophore-interacting protein [Paracoccus seriniphilus]SNT68602.1 NADPH-dependent ferric siderophore reductase, contains FAD-binding and SIP domains [Paracoccus seriniphilus]